MYNYHKTVGIIGGMGPAATQLLFQYIIEETAAEKDQDHIHVIIDNDPSIPDRTLAIKEGSVEPLKRIIEVADRLYFAGADILAIPCNTSHYFIDDIQKQVSIPVVNMIYETAQVCYKRNLNIVGVLATDGTVQCDIYGREFSKFGIRVVYPSKVYQADVMRAIYDYVKAGKEIDETFLQPCIEDLALKKCQAYVLGCTELPFVFRNSEDDSMYIDTMRILARVLIQKAGYKPNRKKVYDDQRIWSLYE